MMYKVFSDILKVQIFAHLIHLILTQGYVKWVRLHTDCQKRKKIAANTSTVVSMYIFGHKIVLVKRFKWLKYESWTARIAPQCTNVPAHLQDVYNASLFLPGHTDKVRETERKEEKVIMTVRSRGFCCCICFVFFVFFSKWSIKIKPSCSPASCPDWKTRSLSSRVCSGGNDTASRLLTQFFLPQMSLSLSQREPTL